MATTQQRIVYGEHPSQFVEAWLPDREPPHTAVVVIHGGWWRAKHDLHLMDGLCADLAASGWLAWNVEFRRVGDGGGWPTTYEDVLAAIDHLVRFSPVPGTVAVGHSSGGHLALLAAAVRPLGGVIALAPVTDLVDSARAGLGEDAVVPFLGAEPEPGAAAYDEASPLNRLPLRCPQLIVHGEDDQRVPVQHSRDYAAMARSAGDEVDYLELPATDHFAVIDPSDASWQQALAWLNDR